MFVYHADCRSVGIHPVYPWDDDCHWLGPVDKWQYQSFYWFVTEAPGDFSDQVYLMDRWRRQAVKYQASSRHVSFVTEMVQRQLFVANEKGRQGQDFLWMHTGNHMRGSNCRWMKERGQMLWGQPVAVVKWNLTSDTKWRAIWELRAGWGKGPGSPITSEYMNRIQDGERETKRVDLSSPL